MFAKEEIHRVPSGVVDFSKLLFQLVEFLFFIVSTSSIHNSSMLSNPKKNQSWKQPLVEMQGNAAYIRPKVVGPFPGQELRALGCPGR
jgi:hypothetical protein